MNAVDSMFVTLLGMVIDVRLVHQPNAKSPMVVTLLGMVEFLHPNINVLLAVLIIALQFSRESNTGFSSATSIEERFEHLEKALYPISFTPIGMVIEVRPVHPENASPPMLVTLFGILMHVNLVQSLNA